MLKMKKAVLFAILGNVIFGFSFLASKIALRTVDPVLLLAIRFTVAFVVLNVLLLLGAFKVRFKGKSLGVLIPMSICQPVIYFLCENYGLQYATSSFSGLMIAMIPAVTFLLATVILKEPFRMNKFAWALCSVAGVCVISVTGGGDGGVSVKGVLFLTGAVASGSLYAVLSRMCQFPGNRVHPGRRKSGAGLCSGMQNPGVCRRCAVSGRGVIHCSIFQYELCGNLSAGNADQLVCQSGYAGFHCGRCGVPR